MVRRPDEVSAALMQTPQQQPVARDPNRMVTAKGNGFEFSGSAADAKRFMMDTGKGDPVAERNRAKAQEQWLGRQPKQMVVESGPNLLRGVSGGGGWQSRMARDKAIIEANAGLARERMQGQNQRANTSMTEGGADRRTNATLRQDLLRDTNKFSHEDNQRLMGQDFTAGENQTQRDFTSGESQSASQRAMLLQRAKANQEAGMKILEAGGDPSVAARTMDNDGVFPVEFGESPLPKKPNPPGTVRWTTIEHQDGTKESMPYDSRDTGAIDNKPPPAPANPKDRIAGRKYTSPTGRVLRWDGYGWPDDKE